MEICQKKYGDVREAMAKAESTTDRRYRNDGYMTTPRENHSKGEDAPSTGRCPFDALRTTRTSRKDKATGAPQRPDSGAQHELLPSPPATHSSQHTRQKFDDGREQALGESQSRPHEHYDEQSSKPKINSHSPPVSTHAHTDLQSIQSLQKCPIRLLPSHSPQDIAAYFHAHKHELPRSHEFCIKRYAHNAEGLRRVDAKYGSASRRRGTSNISAGRPGSRTVNLHEDLDKHVEEAEKDIEEPEGNDALAGMIKGLGERHWNFLPPETPIIHDVKSPENEDDIDEEVRTNGMDEETSDGHERVKQWAETAAIGAETELEPEPGLFGEGITSGEGVPGVELGHREIDESRESHFERPLRDIRVGESPSRPWGVRIPVPKSSIPSSKQSMKSNVNLPVEDDKAHGSKSSALTNEQRRSISSSDAPRNGAEKSSARMLFTGPVFIGYPPDHAASLLKMQGLAMGTSTQVDADLPKGSS